MNLTSAVFFSFFVEKFDTPISEVPETRYLVPHFPGCRRSLIDRKLSENGKTRIIRHRWEIKSARSTSEGARASSYQMVLVLARFLNERAVGWLAGWRSKLVMTSIIFINNIFRYPRSLVERTRGYANIPWRFLDGMPQTNGRHFGF